MLCLDLDRFKAVNDSLGHPIGDALLKQVSERLLSCVRQGDLVARLGGDEFAIIQASARDPNQTESLASRIVETVSQRYDIEGHRIDISTSVGITLAPRDGARADQLMKNADLALYRSKAAGRRGYLVLQPEMNDAVEGRRTLESRFAPGPRQRRTGNLLSADRRPRQPAHYTGFEALRAGSHPSRGMLPADELMRLPKTSGSASRSQTGRCVGPAPRPRNGRCRSSWRSTSCPRSLRRNLTRPACCKHWPQSRLPPNRLELEIAETVLLQDNQNTLALLHQLRQLGVAHRHGRFRHRLCSLSAICALPLRQDQNRPSSIADVERSEEASRHRRGDRSRWAPTSA